ncbi:hypothetical protein [Acinetobacter baumannii]|uniref:hypothetical protein n=1 Tax=Acinetobacter baumannii TaxID=470 RepID=UPI000BF432FD|nr:hypothetical protein [Acinetobacter baumannii]
MEFINEHLNAILTFIAGLLSGITVTITAQKTIFNRNRNTVNQSNNKVKSKGPVKFTGGDDNSTK